MNELTVGIDAGNNEVKVASAYGLDKFASTIGEYRERNMTDTHGDSDIEWEYEGKKGFAGTLAQAESEFGGSTMGESKAHFDAKLRILLALHRIKAPINRFNIVVGQPISRHTAEEKDAIKRMLIGNHALTVNGRFKLITISRAEVAAEGGTAFWSAPTDGLVRIVDLGSATVNCASLRDGRYIDRDSFTLPFGCNNVKTRDFGAMAEGIAKHLSRKWSAKDCVYVVGGATADIVEHLRNYYGDTSELTPLFNGIKQSPIYANAIGFYQIGRALYEGNR